MTSQIEFDYSELENLKHRVQEAGSTVGRISINEGFRRLGRLIVPATGTGPLADETPKRSGKLARSTVFQILGGPRNQILEVRQAAQSILGTFYGFIVREGRGPVTAINAKALHFFIGDQEFFRKSVGPAAANPYHRRVFNRLKPQIQQIVNDMGRRILGHLSGKAT